MATNDPNTVRPRAPTTKRKREDKLLPFPKRRLAAVLRENETSNDGTKGVKKNKKSALGESVTDSPMSDESWPTDKDEAIATLRSRKPKNKILTKTTRNLPPKKSTKKPLTNKKPKLKKKPQKREIDGMISALQTPLPRTMLNMNSALEQKETRELIKKHTARIRAKKARILKKVKNTTVSIEAPVVQKDPLARAIDMAGILEYEHDEQDEDSTVQAAQQMEADNTELDRTIDHVLQALETPSNSSSTSGESTSTESSSYSSSSDSETWGTVKRYVQNPFAQAKTKNTASVSLTINEAEMVHSTDSSDNGSIKRTPPLKKLSVAIKKLSNMVISKFITPAPSTSYKPTDMSAKNISKDRSSSRGRADKPDRFNKGRTGDTGTGNDSSKEQHGTEQEASGQGHGPRQKGAGAGQEIPSGKRPRDPPKTGSHDDTMGEDFEDEEMPGAKRPMTSIREKLTHVYTKRTKERERKGMRGERSPR